MCVRPTAFVLGFTCPESLLQAEYCPDTTERNKREVLFSRSSQCLENKTHLIKKSLEAQLKADWEQELKVGLENPVSHRWVLLRNAAAKYQHD